MKNFKTIREFAGLKSICDFCGGQVGPELFGKKKPSLPYYNMDFGKTTFHGAPWEIERAFFEDEEPSTRSPITYSSDLTGNNLNFYYSMKGSKNLIFSVDIDTNRVSSDINRVQKVIWDHQLIVFLSCISCRSGYAAESNPLCLERKSGIILPTQLSIEAIVTPLDDKDYALVSVPKLKTTILYSSTMKEIVTKLPCMTLHTMSSKDNIVNKIKTIMVFS